MNWKSLILLFFSLSTLHCVNKDECPKDTKISYVVQQFQKDYFPYKHKQNIVFEKYEDSIKIGDVVFTIDSSPYLDFKNQEKECYGGSVSIHYVTFEHFLYKLINQTETNMSGIIEFDGGYFERTPPLAYDPTSLKIKFYDYNNTIYNFEDLVKNGHSKNWIDSLIINGKYYGKAICYQPSWTKRIYFNSQYGIIMYLDEEKKIQLILK